MGGGVHSPINYLIAGHENAPDTVANGDQDSKVSRHIGDQNSSGHIYPTFVNYPIK